MKNIKLDIKNLPKLKKIFVKNRPDYVFHLAAQSLVKKSFERPVDTFMSNTLGTMNILESLSLLKTRCHAVIIQVIKVIKI